MRTIDFNLFFNIDCCDSNSNHSMPSKKTEAACQTQAAIDAAFNAWLATGYSARLFSENDLHDNTGVLINAVAPKRNFYSYRICGTTQTCSATLPLVVQ
jgi:hypothetical protein